MSVECAIVDAAKKLAIKKGLDPDLVSCNQCGLTGVCPYAPEDLVEESVLDAVDEGFVKALEGRQQVGKFYDRLSEWAERNGQPTP